MTVAKTIAIANQHAKNGNVEGACRILESAKRAARSNRSQWAFEIAKARILDAAVDAMVARSQSRAA
jgi:hypothetical protein